METAKFNYKDIPGWGMDADPENEPTYPIKEYTGDDHDRINYARSEQQPIDVEVLMSIERPAMPRVFGTSVPPSGLSGMIRRYAFKHSEDRYRHWIPLILADRINVAEGVINDIKDGRIPDIVSEGGWKVEWKYNSRAIILKFAAISATVVLYYCLRHKKGKI